MKKYIVGAAFVGILLGAGISLKAKFLKDVGEGIKDTAEGVGKGITYAGKTLVNLAELEVRFYMMGGLAGKNMFACKEAGRAWSRNPGGEFTFDGYNKKYCKKDVVDAVIVPANAFLINMANEFLIPLDASIQWRLVKLPTDGSGRVQNITLQQRLIQIQDMTNACLVNAGNQVDTLEGLSQGTTYKNTFRPLLDKQLAIAKQGANNYDLLSFSTVRMPSTGALRSVQAALVDEKFYNFAMQATLTAWIDNMTELLPTTVSLAGTKLAKMGIKEGTQGTIEGIVKDPKDIAALKAVQECLIKLRDQYVK